MQSPLMDLCERWLDRGLRAVVVVGIVVGLTSWHEARAQSAAGNADATNPQPAAPGRFKAEEIPASIGQDQVAMQRTLDRADYR